jgi:hypothetical protein
VAELQEKALGPGGGGRRGKVQCSLGQVTPAFFAPVSGIVNDGDTSVRARATRIDIRPRHPLTAGPESPWDFNTALRYQIVAKTMTIGRNSARRSIFRG